MTMISDQMISESTPRTLASVGGDVVVLAEGLPHGVERAGADVAVDHAERAQRQQAEPALGAVASAVTVARSGLVLTGHEVAFLSRGGRPHVIGWPVDVPAGASLVVGAMLSG